MPLKLFILILVYMTSPSLRQFLILILFNLPASLDTFDHLLLLGMISKRHSPLTFSFAPDISFSLWASFSSAHQPLNNGLTQELVPKPLHFLLDDFIQGFKYCLSIDDSQIPSPSRTSPLSLKLLLSFSTYMSNRHLKYKMPQLDSYIDPSPQTFYHSLS